MIGQPSIIAASPELLPKPPCPARDPEAQSSPTTLFDWTDENDINEQCSLEMELDVDSMNPY
jgi:hypothetical protein